MLETQDVVFKFELLCAIGEQFFKLLCAVGEKFFKLLCAIGEEFVQTFMCDYKLATAYFLNNWAERRGFTITG